MPYFLKHNKNFKPKQTTKKSETNTTTHQTNKKIQTEIGNKKTQTKQNSKQNAAYLGQNAQSETINIKKNHKK